MMARLLPSEAMLPDWLIHHGKLALAGYVFGLFWGVPL